MKLYPKLAVCLDNGHAKSTPGKRSPYLISGQEPALSFYEYKFNREIVARLKSKLEELGISVCVCCPEVDEDIKLTQRSKRANEYKWANRDKTCVFLSIHADALGNGDQWNKARGWSAYTTKGQNISDIFAECLYDAAEKIFVPKGLKVRTDLVDGDRDFEENFTVINGALMPAVLTENFFYTNPDDCAYLLSEEGMNDIVQVHLEGILKFAERQYGM